MGFDLYTVSCGSYERFHKDFSFNEAVGKPCMFFFEGFILGQIAVHGFGIGCNVSAWLVVAIFDAEVVVIHFRADSLAGDVPNAVVLRTVGEEPPKLGFGQIAVGLGQSFSVKLAVVGIHIGDSVLFHQTEDELTGGVKVHLMSKSSSHIFQVEVVLVSIICRVHEHRVVEDVRNYQGVGFNNISIGRKDNKSEVIDKRVGQIVGGFHINKQNVIFQHDGFLSVRFNLCLIITFIWGSVNPFFKTFLPFEMFEFSEYSDFAARQIF